MNLTSEQAGAYDAIATWFNTTAIPYFTLHGFAGTGKTFLMQHIVNNWDGEVYCCAPTGKAASVLKSKLNGKEVTTVHGLIYAPKDKSVMEYVELKAKLEGTPNDKVLAHKVEKLRKKLTNTNVGFDFVGGENSLEGKLVVVDEASMVTSQMREDFELTGARVVYVGDGGQLPPVGDNGWFLNERPDAVLKSVQRQALDNPIIRLSMAVREGSYNKVDFKGYDQCRILNNKRSLSRDEWFDADQVITGMNATRRGLNRWFRQELGYTDDEWWPQRDERMICLKNMRGTPFINGVQFLSTYEAEYLEDDDKWMLDFIYEGAEYENMPFYEYHCDVTYDKNAKEEPFSLRRGLFECDFAYAITCHKSQGSEWDTVILADDNMRAQDHDMRKRWLYTGITRAKENLILLENCNK